MSLPVTFTETELPGVFEVSAGFVADERGFLMENYVEAAWRSAGFDIAFVQDNVSLSAKGTLRGMHYQLEPHGMGKLVRVLRGRAFDVAVDLRRGSPTFGKWVGRMLDAGNKNALWIPVGFAHGFLAMEDDTMLYYKCSNVYVPQADRALLYSDPAIAIAWPAPPERVSPKDRQAPPLERADINFIHHPVSRDQ